MQEHNQVSNKYRNSNRSRSRNTFCRSRSLILCCFLLCRHRMYKIVQQHTKVAFFILFYFILLTQFVLCLFLLLQMFKTLFKTFHAYIFSRYYWFVFGNVLNIDGMKKIDSNDAQLLYK